MPWEPPVTVSNLRTMEGNRTAMASVTSARYSPFSRSAGIPITTPTAKAMTAPAGKVQPGLQPWSTTRMPVA